MTSILRLLISVMRTCETFAGESAFAANTEGSSDHSMMSIFSPRSSRMMLCTREPFMPTQAPTGSTSRSRLNTATLARSPGARHGGFGPAEVDDDVAALEALDGAVHDLAHAVDVFVVDLLALGLADA